MKLSADYRALALNALRGRWKTAVLAGLIASLLGANIVSSSDRVISNMSQNANGDTPGFAGLLSTGSGGVLAVLVICILAWAVFTVIVSGAVRLGYARFNLNLADGRDAALSDLASQKHRLWDGFCMNFLQGLYVALWALLLFIPEVMLHVSRPVRWDSDHVTIMNDDTLELCKEIARTQPYHLGDDTPHVAVTAKEFETLKARHRAEGRIVDELAGGISFIQDPDGHLLEILPPK